MLVMYILRLTVAQIETSPSSKGEAVVVLGELEDSKKTANEQLRRWPKKQISTVHTNGVRRNSHRKIEKNKGTGHITD